jgi:hypothetical protein
VSLIPGNVEVLAFGVQSDKATPASAPTMAIALEDNSLDPGVQYVSAAETDSNAVQPDDNVVGAEPGGTFKCYARPSESDFFLYSLLGKNVDTGAGPYTHTQNIDPAAPFASPYLTIWNIWPGIACVKYTGCRIGKAAYTAQPGGMVEAEYTSRRSARRSSTPAARPASPAFRSARSRSPGPSSLSRSAASTTGSSTSSSS